ncbi:MAG: homocysteine S-methyltransferase family protein [Ignavibacteriales bacterium]|nr:homocysteine S-methyltransferase family protein [Ignavibacteriales bacterium]
MNVAELLKEKTAILFDGANGTEYQRRGLETGLSPESWNLSNAPMVEKIHLEYISAGSMIVETNTFGANRKRLEASGLENKLKEINSTAADLALSAANGNALVAGSVGPLGALIEPYGDISKDEARRIFQEQIRLLLDAGVHLIAIETMMSLEEALLALEAGRYEGAKTIAVTMTFEPTPEGPRTPFGESPSQVVQTLERMGATIVGSNCGRGFDVMRAVAKEMKSAAKVPVLVQPNAGIPTFKEKTIFYPENPEQYAEFVKDMLSLGVELIGGCCGTTAEHIAAAKKVVQRVFAALKT